MQNEVKKVKQHRFKFLTFFSALMMLIMAMGLVWFIFYMFTDLWPAWMGDNGAEGIIAGVFLFPLLLCFGVLGCALIILYLILGVFLMMASFKDDREFSRKKSLMISVIVINFIIAAISLILMMNGGNSVLVFIIISAAMILNSILLIIDMSLFNRRQRKRIENGEVEEKANPIINVDFSALSENSLEAELKRLNKLFKEGTISKEEYDHLRQSKIDKFASSGKEKIEESAEENFEETKEEE